MYRPIKPRIQICTDDKKNTPITSGAIPNSKEFQNNILYIKKIIATIIEKKEQTNPKLINNFTGNIEYFVMLEIAISSKEKSYS